MSKKLDSIKPYIKFYLQHAIGQPISDDAINALCERKTMVSIANVGEGYVLVSETRLATRREFEEGGEECN